MGAITDVEWPEPTCDECGVPCEEADGWCGECGNCLDHCQNTRDCHEARRDDA